MWSSAWAGGGQGPAKEPKLVTGRGRKLGQPGARGKGKALKEESRYQSNDDGIEK